MSGFSCGRPGATRFWTAQHAQRIRWRGSSGRRAALCVRVRRAGRSDVAQAGALMRGTVVQSAECARFQCVPRVVFAVSLSSVCVSCFVCAPLPPSAARTSETALRPARPLCPLPRRAHSQRSAHEHTLTNTMSSKSAASKKRARNSKGSAAPTAAGAGAAADEPTTLQAEPTAAAADGVALDANNIAAGAEGDDAASAALRSSKARKLHVGDAASSDEAAAAAATAPNGIAADEHAATAAANDVSMSNAHAASAPVTPAAAVDGGAAAAADTSVDSSVAGSPAAVATPASSATPSRSPTPAQSSPTSAVTTGGVPKSPSRPTPSPTAGLTSGGAIVVSPLPPLPAGMNRGYCAQFYWSHYPPAAAGSATAASIPAALLPQFTDVVASIPAIFQQIISVLQTLEQTVHNRVRQRQDIARQQRALSSHACHCCAHFTHCDAFSSAALCAGHFGGARSQDYQAPDPEGG